MSDEWFNDDMRLFCHYSKSSLIHWICMYTQQTDLFITKILLNETLVTLKKNWKRYTHLGDK